jgi:perosamine synthetase
LFPIKLHLNSLSITRDDFIDELKRSGVGCSVHWRPLHLHPYYQETFGWRPDDFPGMQREEVERVANTVRSICGAFARVHARSQR